jgi:hypothetical protein
VYKEFIQESKWNCPLKGIPMRKFALAAMILGMPLFSHAQAGQNSWAALNTLQAGQRIEIVETNLKKHNATFSTVTDEAIQIREGTGDVGIKRGDVIRVTVLDKSHRLRNSLILGAVGAGAGAGIGAAATRCSNSSGAYNFCGIGRGAAIGLGAAVGLVGGGAIGAAIPSHPTIYRVEHR